MCVTNSILDNVIPNISEYMSINTYIYNRNNNNNNNRK